MVKVQRRVCGMLGHKPDNDATPSLGSGTLWKSGWKDGKRGRLKGAKTKQHLGDTAGLMKLEQLRLPARDEASQHSPTLS